MEIGQIKIRRIFNLILFYYKNQLWSFTEIKQFMFCSVIKI